MASVVPIQTPNIAQNLDKNVLYLVGPNFWHVRGRFKILKLIDIETQMSIIKLHNGKFLIIDTVEMNDRLRQEIDLLTNDGRNIEAVIGTHPFHTVSFPAFYQTYPNAAYYGTPRHLRRLTEIPWRGNLNDRNIRKKWKPDIEMRIPAGAEFINPQPESSNHFVSVFVYHPISRTLHVDDTIMFTEKPSFLLKLFGYQNGIMAFHPSIKNSGLYPTSNAPYLFRDWMRKLLHDWPFENICCAHLGIKMGGAHADVTTLLNNAEPLFAKISEKNRKKYSEYEIPVDNHSNMNVSDNEYG
ncbi:unnamed protein product [Rotaria sordida]|uniref:Metallo-beta-lactamase domain-containing protein n=2 Tax=Rotaria sordida TaxID=392033 RepID=A0A815EBL0_9BILA|nr:unnamed protein product [Rotaria sordida]CAF1380584.1 unnamed protein product [Rotaria sordida]CAF3683266.1 unnamed protein product [Rotaria sordida]CAF4123432.1 unnamed protein product [Rotaria sordida]